jgi:hypothetical protein
LTSEGTDLLDRADADTVGRAEGAIDCPGLGHAHLGSANERGDVGWICVAVANEAFARFGFVDRGLKCPALSRGVTECRNGLGVNTSATASASKTHQPCMRYIPSTLEKEEIPCCYRELMFTGKLS